MGFEVNAWACSCLNLGRGRVLLGVGLSWLVKEPCQYSRMRRCFRFGVDCLRLVEVMKENFVALERQGNRMLSVPLIKWSIQASCRRAGQCLLEWHDKIECGMVSQ